jgi:N6-L-threonylcarbamoyladenine synthase
LAVPPVRLCTDNAVMVAWAGIERLRLGLADGLEFAPRPRWPMEALEDRIGRRMIAEPVASRG